MSQIADAYTKAALYKNMPERTKKAIAQRTKRTIKAAQLDDISSLTPYSIVANPTIGQALIINIYNCVPQRIGSEIDLKNITHSLATLNFDVIAKQDLTASEMNEAIDFCQQRTRKLLYCCADEPRTFWIS
jgi:hypothetical protein